MSRQNTSGERVDSPDGPVVIRPLSPEELEQFGPVITQNIKHHIKTQNIEGVNTGDPCQGTPYETPVRRFRRDLIEHLAHQMAVARIDGSDAAWNALTSLDDQVRDEYRQQAEQSADRYETLDALMRWVETYPSRETCHPPAEASRETGGGGVQS